MPKPKTKLNKYISYFLEATSSSEKEFTKGSINKAIFMLSIPVIIEMVGEGLFAIFDMYFVAKLGKNALAAVGLTESIMFIVYSIAIGFSMAASAIISRRIGEKNKTDASNATLQAIILAIIVGLATGLLGIYYAKDILELMGAEPDVIIHGISYTKWMFGSNIIIMLLFIINGAFRGAGNSAIAMRVLLIANAINIILDPLFIFGLGPIPALGIKGAAIATSTGRGIAVLIQVYYLFISKNSSLHLVFKELKIQLNVIFNIIKISLGGIGQFLVESASWLVLYRFISEIGTNAVAGYTIGFRIIGFTILPAWGLAQAAAALVGQNLGAKQPERAEKSVWRSSYYNAIYLLLISILFYAIAKYIISMVFTNDADVLPMAVKSLQIICLGYVFFAFGMVVSQAFNGAGDTLTPTAINIICFWVIQIPMVFWFTNGLDLGFEGILYCIAICHSIHAVISVYLFKRGKWKLRKV
ncbi:MAG: MATE family efflux transporter [Bacteroidia bacterium]